MIRFLFAFVAAAVLSPQHSAWAQAPSPLQDRPVTLVVPFAPGGGTDILARLIGARLQTALHQVVIVDNRPGANGQLASQFVERARADGHTLLFGSSSTHVLAPLLSPEKGDIDSYRRNFAMVSVVAGTPQVLAVSAKSPWQNLAQFLAAKPADGLTFGTFGAGSTPHLLGSLIASKRGIALVHVPYKGSSAAITDLLGGHIDSVFLTVAAIEKQVEAHEIRALAVTGEGRVATLPGVPTFKESGIGGLENSGWFAILAPAKTDAKLVAYLHDRLTSIMAEPDMQARLLDLGLQGSGGSIRADNDIWQKSIDTVSDILKRTKIDLGDK